MDNLWANCINTNISTHGVVFKFLIEMYLLTSTLNIKLIIRDTFVNQ